MGEIYTALYRGFNAKLMGGKYTAVAYRASTVV
jgi:hypothetical protein